MNNNHVGVLLEDIQDQLSKFAESMADVPSQVRSIDERLKVVEADMKVVKAVVTDQSKELHNHETRITHLEAKAA